MTVATVACLATACSKGSSSPECGPASAPTPPIEPALGIAGQLLSFDMGVSRTCATGTTLTATLTVVDPDNLPVTVDNPTREVTGLSDGEGARTTVSFTPARAGPYHVRVRFDPNLGDAQSDVLVAADVSMTARPSFVVPDTSDLAKSGCTHLEITAAQNVLCISPVPALYASDAGGLLQTFDADDAALARSVVWLHRSDGVMSRWVEGTSSDGGAGFTQSPEAVIARGGLGPVVMLPTENDLVFVTLDTGEVRLITVTDAGFSPVVQPLGFETQQLFAISRDGDSMFAVLASSDLQSAGVCPFSFDAGPSPCAFVQGTPLAADADGVWTRPTLFSPTESSTPQSLDVRREGVKASLPLPSSEALGIVDRRRPQGQSVILTAPSGPQLLPSYADTLALTLWPAGRITSVTRDWLALEVDGQLKIYRR